MSAGNGKSDFTLLFPPLPEGWILSSQDLPTYAAHAWYYTVPCIERDTGLSMDVYCAITITNLEAAKQRTFEELQALLDQKLLNGALGIMHCMAEKNLEVKG